MSPSGTRLTRSRRLVGLLSAAALALSGCGGGGTTATSATKVGPLDPDKKVEIVWWHGQSAEAAAILGKLAREYEKAHPNVKIKDSAGASSTDELLQKMQAGLASDTYPDVSYAFGSWAGKLAQSGKTLDTSGWDKAMLRAVAEEVGFGLG